MGGGASKSEQREGTKEDNPTQKPRPFSTKTDQTEQTAQEQLVRPKYKRLDLLGEGTSGKVYQCIDLATNQHYAMKVVTLVSKTKTEAVQEVENLKREIAMLKRLNHKNIVKYYSFDVSEDRKSVQIVLEKVTPGNLRDLVKKKPLSQQEASKMCRQILHALKYLHGQGIIHRDLKGANILINEEGTPKISDFGTAKIIETKTVEDGIAVKSRSLKGTPYWMAPEVLKRTGHTFSADIWSLGCTLIEMITGLPPWANISNRFEEIINYIASGIQPPFPPNISKTCQKFLNCCLDSNPTKRLSADQLLNHTFIREPNQQDSIEEIDINLLEPYRPAKMQHSKNLRNQPAKVEQYERLALPEKVERPLKGIQNQPHEKTSRRKVSKMNKDTSATRQSDSSGPLDYIQTKASKKEREDLQQEQMRKELQRREKARLWQEQLKREAERRPPNK